MLSVMMKKNPLYFITQYNVLITEKTIASFTPKSGEYFLFCRQVHELLGFHGLKFYLFQQ